jgi:hypothetical protein
MDSSGNQHAGLAVDIKGMTIEGFIIGEIDGVTI